MKVLVPTDGSDYSMKAVQKALDLAKTGKAEVTILAVAYYAKEDLDEMPPSIQEKLEGEASAALKKAKAVFESNAVPAAVLLKADLVPANSIIQVAQQGSFDEIIMGSRGKMGLDRILLGSTAAKVTANAPCSVSVVR